MLLAMAGGERKYTKALIYSSAKSAFTAWISSFGAEHKKGQLTIIFYWLNDSRSNLWVMTVVKWQCLQPPQPQLEEVVCLLFFPTAQVSVQLPRLQEAKMQVPFWADLNTQIPYLFGDGFPFFLKLHIHDVKERREELDVLMIPVNLWSSRGFLEFVPVFWPEAKVSVLGNCQKDKRIGWLWWHRC